MTDDDEPRERHGRRGILDRIFPLEHDFLKMLVDQAEQTRSGVEAFVAWLETGCAGPPDEVRRIERDLDQMRYELEEQLIDAFSTPFDREDLYSLSRQMDYILNFSSRDRPGDARLRRRARQGHRPDGRACSSRAPVPSSRG